MNAFEVRGLTKEFASQPVLRRLHLSISQGSIYGLLGRNGAGKTTLLKTLIGLFRPTDGEVRVLGNDMTVDNASFKQPLAFVSESGIIPGWLKINEVLRFEEEVRPSFRRQPVEEWLVAESLGASRRVQQLSKGQRKRLELEIALASDAKVLLLDEPFDGLDPVARAETMERLLYLSAGGDVTVVISSHIMADLERLCSTLGILADRHIHFESSVDALKSSYFAEGPVGGLHLLPSEKVVVLGSGNFLLLGCTETERVEAEKQGFRLSVASLDEATTALLRNKENSKVWQ